MVEYPDGYTMRSRLTAALNEPLRREVFLDGLTPEFSSLAELLSAAERIENTMQYQLAWRMEESSSDFAAPPDPIPSEEWD